MFFFEEQLIYSFFLFFELFVNKICAGSIENIKQIQELERNKGQLPGITTGFTDLDKLLGGLHKTDLIILAARPGMGKTAFALNLAGNAAAEGASVIIFSMEMSKEQLGERMFATAASVEMEHLKRGNLTQDEWMSLSEAQDSFENCKIVIDDTSDISVLEIKNKCRRRKAEAGLDLIVIDYLQLMSQQGFKSGDRVNEISAITRQIKILAKELDCAVILLSQLSRDIEKRPNHKGHNSKGAVRQKGHKHEVRCKSLPFQHGYRLRGAAAPGWENDLH